MTSKKEDVQRDTAAAAEQVLRLAAERGHITQDQAESTIAEVRERLEKAGLYDLDDPSIEVVIPDHLLQEDTLARLARELGLKDEDWRPHPSTDSGDGSEPAVLEEAGARQADVLISLAPYDPDNLVACQIAQKLFGVPRTLALVNDPDNEAVFQQLGIADIDAHIERQLSKVGPEQLLRIHARHHMRPDVLLKLLSQCFLQGK